MDRITHLPKTAEGHTSIFVAVDKLTKMVRLAAGHDTDDAEATATRSGVLCFGLMACLSR